MFELLASFFWLPNSQCRSPLSPFVCVYMCHVQPVQSIADRYARKLKSRVQRTSEENEEASLGEQAGLIQVCTMHKIRRLGNTN